MNTVQQTRRRLTALVFALLIATAATALPTLSDRFAGTSLVTPIFACQHAGGECG